MSVRILKEASIRQLFATLDMTSDIIEKCPESYWNQKISGHVIWQLIYHPLFYVDFYSNDLDKSIMHPAEDYRPSDIFTENRPNSSLTDPGVVIPTKNQLKKFIGFLKTKTKELIMNATEEDLQQISSFEWLGMTKLECVLYYSRHLMEHVGQVSGYLRKDHGIVIKWKGVGNIN